MSKLPPLVVPNNHIAKREQIAIDIVKSLRNKGFTEQPYDKGTNQRVFTKFGCSEFRLSVKDGRANYGKLSWHGDKFHETATFITNLITTDN